MFDENLYQETISALHASEDTLSEVMNMTHKTKRRGRLRTTAVLAAVIAILCCMAAAAAALGLDQRLAEYFGATAEQEELLSTAAVPMNIVKRDSGAVMRIEQVIADRYCAAVLIDFTAPEGEVCYTDLESILKTLVDDAVARGVCEDNSTARDLFDTKLMGVLTPRPSIVRANFEERYENEGPQAATDWFYKFSQDTDYIRRYRIKRDLKWVTKTEYGDLDITINLSKPEKDPKAIAAAKLAPQSAYPKCQLCVENEGYAGRMNHPARENHRIIPLTINDSAWNLQYSPYVYYNEHCIVFNNQHTPMKIERATFRKLLDFVGLFPHYFVGSNADLPIVGGSILSHDHFQGGHYEFAMAKAPIEKPWVFPGFEDVEAGIVHWPMSCIRLT